MSADLYPVRVYFEPSRRGCAKCPGVARYYLMPPKIPGLPEFEALDYAGDAFYPEIQPVDGKRREMTAREVASLVAWLNELKAEPPYTTEPDARRNFTR